MMMIDQDFTSFPSDELLAQVDDSVLSKFVTSFSRLVVKLHASFNMCHFGRTVNNSMTLLLA